MNHNFVFNTLSLPAENSDSAYTLLFDSAKGMLAVGSGNDRFALYSDDLLDRPVAPDYYYRDFIVQLEEHHEVDLQLALLEIEDKTPMLDFLSEELFDEIASSSFYFPNEAYTGSIDVLATAWFLDATLLSIATKNKWLENEIEFAKYSSDKPSTGSSYLRNISCENHGYLIKQQYQFDPDLPLTELFPNCEFSHEFSTWINQLPSDLFKHVVNKIKLAYSKEFQGGEPLFKTLHNSNGIREIRFNAVQGGAVRILFKVLSASHSAILFGFIKKSKREGYKEAIDAAIKILDGLRE
jgi:hypothetical protein